MSESLTPKRKHPEVIETNTHKRPRLEEKSLKRETQQEINNRPLKQAKTMKTTLSNSATKSQPKKLTVSFKARPTLPSNYEEETWGTLKKAINAVQTKQPISTTQEDLYQAVENMVDHKMSEKLYINLEKECDQHVQHVFQTLLSLLPNTTPEKFLLVLRSYWDDHCHEMLLIRSFFMCLDRKYTLQTSGIKSIWDMGLHLFCKYISDAPEILEKTRAGLLKLIENDRKGEDVDKILIKNLLRMLTSLGLYASQFEKYFLDETAVFYQHESQHNLESLPISEFLLHIEHRIEEEGQRVAYLDSSTKRPLIQNIERVALAVHVDSILERGFDELADKNSIQDLKRLYSLFSRVDGLGKLKACWNAYIKKRGLSLVTDEQRDKTMVEELLQFKERIDALLRQSFCSNSEFLYSQKEAFEHFVNQRQNAPAELLAKFIDSKLRSGKERRNLNETELETVLDKSMQIFRYISGKDVFEAFYKKDLAKRLLLNNSSSIDAEKSMIQKLKVECGANFTTKLEGMFKDIDASQETVELFKQSRHYLDWGSPFDTKIFILTTGFWPPYSQVNCIIPTELDTFCKAFEAFYTDKHSGRRLQWQHNLGQCTLRAVFTQGVKELSVSLYQTAVLLLFNIKEKWTFKEIQDQTELEEGELRRTLMSLAMSSAKVLTKSEGQNNEILPTDVFTFRKEFTSKGRRIKINAIQVKETSQEQQKTQQNVFKDRQYQVDAAIVRIMKTRKTLSQTQLTSEILGHLRFPVQIPDLKKRIDSLVEREFLEKDEADPNMLHYVA